MYTSIVAGGIEERHLQLEYYLKVDYMHTLINGRKPQHLDDAESVSERLASIALTDILMALGRTNRVYGDEGEELWNADDVAAIDRVWWGSHTRPAILADMFTKASKQ